MNNATTTVAPYTFATGAAALDQFYALFINPLIAIQFYQIGYPFLFLLGFLGNLGSLLTFSRPTLRKISTGCLFMVLAISDLLYLFICVIDFLEFGLKVAFYRHVAYNELCRFRMFVMNAAQVASAWILVLVSIDRWIRTRFPFKSGMICTPKKALLAVAVLLILDIALHAHLLTPMFGFLIPGYINGACGPSLFSIEYFIFYYYTWNFIQIFTTCLIPVFLMVIILIDIFISIRIRKRAVVQPNHGGHGNQQNTHHKQMFILMFASICIYFISNLPATIGKIVFPRNNQITTEAARLTTILTALIWFQSFNFAINFYIHCLTSTLFRKEFKEQMQFIFRRNQRLTPVIEIPRTEKRIEAK